MFKTVPTYDRYRTLSLQKPMLKGEDVWALQHALDSLGIFDGTIDGILGPMTDSYIREAQDYYKLVVDGAAGGKTQTALAIALAAYVGVTQQVPKDALRGQLEHESGFRLGNYSPQRPDGYFDAGVAQRNTKFVSAELGFNPSLSIIALADNTRKHYDLFEGVADNKRRWGLAQGAWNAPAYGCYLAREEGAKHVTVGMTLRLSPVTRAIFETYVSTVSKYL